MALHPGRDEKAAIIGYPHPAQLFRVFDSPQQIHFTFHVWFFQLSTLSEPAVAANDFAFVDYLWKLWCPGFEDASHLAGVKQSLAAPGALSAALGYYKAVIDAATDGTAPPALFESVAVPTLS